MPHYTYRNVKKAKKTSPDSITLGSGVSLFMDGYKGGPAVDAKPIELCGGFLSKKNEELDYKIKTFVIYRDNSRPHGHYYAEVMVNGYGPNKNLEFVKNIEVILNGPGKSKAKKKVRQQLYSFGIRNGRLPIKIEFEPKFKEVKGHYRSQLKDKPVSEPHYSYRSRWRWE